ncbi:MAG: hypothetical protein ACJAY8_001120 [Sphingobacteriales bacterium]|jgi:hypothetical protein
MKTIIPFLFLVLTLSSKAQLNLDFEVWENDFQPIGWYCPYNFVPFSNGEIADTNVVRGAGFVGDGARLRPTAEVVNSDLAYLALGDGSGFPVEFSSMIDEVRIMHNFRDSTQKARVLYRIKLFKSMGGSLVPIAVSYDFWVTNRTVGFEELSIPLLQTSEFEPNDVPTNLSFEIYLYSYDTLFSDYINYTIDNIQFRNEGALGVKETFRRKCSVFPTVSKDYYYFDSGGKNGSLLITDNMGREVLRSKNVKKRFSLKGMNSGMYNFHFISTEQGCFSRILLID